MNFPYTSGRTLLCICIAALLLQACETLKRSPASLHTSTTKGRTSPPPRATTNSKPAPKPSGPYDRHVRTVIQEARSYTGTPYRAGGNDKRGIDCSGLICSVYTQVGYSVPRVSWQQSEFGREVERIEDIRPGDWIFFVPDAGKEGYVSHAGIVTEVHGKSDIRFIHASSSRGVREDNLFSSYFKNRFVKALRPF
ncbi:C40 family peptidase [Arundinibacter roseus]|uniref:NlpC/P60 family protein n=1 Tax=Arundinibacter roseus TaxID=2070510 RepID=A0A4V2X9P9_9BACT|nr:C40 family peptidase [Arundinibacter roseus]TDB64625.1 NlpC/P60 family protein [Arundinibacter roseus]